MHGSHFPCKIKGMKGIKPYILEGFLTLKSFDFLAIHIKEEIENFNNNSEIERTCSVLKHTRICTVLACFCFNPIS